jgi:hypothetical protein
MVVTCIEERVTERWVIEKRVVKGKFKNEREGVAAQRKLINECFTVYTT